MRFLDSFAVEERDSPELPALNIPFANQTEATAADIEDSKTEEQKDPNAKTNIVTGIENSRFQFLYEQ